MHEIEAHGAAHEGLPVTTLQRKKRSGGLLSASRFCGPAEELIADKVMRSRSGVKRGTLLRRMSGSHFKDYGRF